MLCVLALRLLLSASQASHRLLCAQCTSACAKQRIENFFIFRLEHWPGTMLPLLLVQRFFLPLYIFFDDSMHSNELNSIIDDLSEVYNNSTTKIPCSTWSAPCEQHDDGHRVVVAARRSNGARALARPRCDCCLIFFNSNFNSTMRRHGKRLRCWVHTRQLYDSYRDYFFFFFLLHVY